MLRMTHVLRSAEPASSLSQPQCIIFLKLLDSGHVSRFILGEVGVGCLIEGWKVSKIARRRGMLTAAFWSGAARGAAGGAPALSATEQATDEADARAMRWLSYGLYPLVVAWGAYSLYYHAHKSWWSWLIQTASHGVYMCVLRVPCCRARVRRAC